MKVLVIDIGGTHVKVLATGQEQEREFVSGSKLTPKRMIPKVRRLAADWKYDAISIGYPGPVLRNRPISEPWNLGKGWMGFNFEAAFGQPVKVINDAAMQALLALQIGRARRMMLAGAPLGERLQGRFGFEIRLIVQGGLAVLDRLEQQQADLFSRPRLRRSDVILMILRAL